MSFKHELPNLWAVKFSFVNKLHIFQCMRQIFSPEFQRVPQNILPILYAEDTILYNVGNLKADIFKNSYAFWKRPQLSQYKVCGNLNSLRPKKWTPFRRRHFQTHFFLMKMFEFRLKFH